VIPDRQMFATRHECAEDQARVLAALRDAADQLDANPIPTRTQAEAEAIVEVWKAQGVWDEMRRKLEPKYRYQMSLAGPFPGQ